MRGWSLEATLPTAAEVDALGRVLPPGTRVYLSALPHVPYARLAEDAARVRRAGLEPVPHLAGRNYGGRGEIEDFLARLRAGASVERVLAIGGDRAAPLGPFASSLELIESGLLQAHGLREVQISGYPEGHPKIADEALARALRDKVEAARGAGLEVRVVSQFCFDAGAIARWLGDFRGAYPDLPVSLGLAGPAGARTLLGYALRCGVKASARGLARGLGQVGGLLGEATPARMVAALADMGVGENDDLVSVHFFSFGGIARTAAWARDFAEAGAEPE